MRRRELTVLLIVFLVIGCGAAGALLVSGASVTIRRNLVGAAPATPDSPTPQKSGTPGDGQQAAGISAMIPRAGAATGMGSGSPLPGSPSSSPTPVEVPVAVGPERGAEPEAALLLYDSRSANSFDVNFCKIVEYYGLGCRKIAVDATPLTEATLRDSLGAYFKIVGVDAATLLGTPSLFTSEQLATLKAAVENGGVNLLVSKVHAGLDFTGLSTLTDGAIQGATKPVGSYSSWTVATEAPEITREFTGQSVPTKLPITDSALVLDARNSVTTLVSAVGPAGDTYPVFVRWKNGAGSVFVDSGAGGDSIGHALMSDLYYYAPAFSHLLPTMFAVRFALGARVWHSQRHFANLTIDDPALIEPYDGMSFIALLQEMNAHNFHTTIAFRPIMWQNLKPEVISLFLSAPSRFSLSQHGNNHDDYEFYKYSVDASDSYEGQEMPARPLEQQRANIIQGLQRMMKHTDLTGIPFDRVMIFPWAISPAPTFAVLKGCNYLGTVNAQDVPLDATHPNRWDYGMYQANLDYEDFPELMRRPVRREYPFLPGPPNYVFDLFLGKPVLLFSHAKEMFGDGMTTFDPVADELNKVQGGLQWRSLGYIIEHLYLEKTNTDGSADIKIYGNQVIIANDTDEHRVYHVSKEETLNVPIAWLTVNGHDFPYQVQNGLLTLNAVVPAHTSLDISIHYGDSSSCPVGR